MVLPDPVVEPQREAERRQPPRRRHGVRQPPLPQPLAAEQFLLQPAGHRVGEGVPLPVQFRPQRLQGRPRFADRRVGPRQRPAEQVEQVRPADGDAGVLGQLRPQRFQQPGELPGRQAAAVAVGLRPQRIHEEQVVRGDLEALAQHPPPVLADVAVLGGPGLHEQHPAALGGGPQFVADAGVAVFLLRGDDQQHVAVRQQFAEPPEVRGGPVALTRLVGRVRVGAVDEDEIPQQAGVGPHDLQPVQRQAERGEFGVGVGDEGGGGGRRPLLAGDGDLLAHQRVHQRALAGPGPAERRHHQRGLQPHPHGLRPPQHPPQQPAGVVERLPIDAFLLPVRDEPTDALQQPVHAGEQIEPVEVGIGGHGAKFRVSPTRQRGGEERRRS